MDNMMRCNVNARYFLSGKIASFQSKKKQCLLTKLIHFLIIIYLFCGSAIAADCLYISSYHAGYEWNDGIEEGIENILENRCNLDKFYMDTKRNPDKQFAEDIAIKARDYIEEKNPDVVIACDDNASKYLIQPYYKNTKRPFVFCGINWTVDEYGYPYTNVTGMIEISPIHPLLKMINKISGKVARGVYLSADVLTEHKDYERYKSKYATQNISLEGVFVKTNEAWKAEFLAAQDADFIVLNNNSGINDWNKEDIKSLIYKTNSTLTVTNYEWMIPYSMLAMTKLPQEQGEWAAQVALTIIQGEKPRDIPIVVNRRWNIFVNSTLIEKSKYSLPSDISTKAVYRDF